ILGPTYDEDKARVRESAYWTTEFVGTGPFLVREFMPGSLVRLVAYSRYVLGRPKIDEIEVRFITSTPTLVANVLANEVASLIAPNQREYREIERSIVRYPYDPRKATQMIEALGYAKGPDGMFRDSAGEPLSLEIRYVTAVDTTRLLSLATADNWKRIGVDT